MSKARSGWAWDLYWQADRLESCVAIGGQEPDRDLKDCWRDWLGNLPAGARLLDVGSGNGALSALAADLSRSEMRDFELHAIDAADIDPHHYAARDRDRLGNVRFQGNILMEDMPFNDGFFDAVMAQYAVEYAPLEPSLREISRVLRPGGRFRFLLHGTNTVLARRSRDELGGLAHIEGSGILDLMKDVLPNFAALHARPERQEEKARNLLARLRAAAIVLGKAGASDGEREIIARFLTDAARLFEVCGSLGPSATLKAIEGMVLQVRARTTRLEDLLRAALDHNAVEGIRNHLGDKGLCYAPAVPARVGAQDINLGWWLDGYKP